MKKITVKVLMCLVILLIGGTLVIGCGKGTAKTSTSHFAANGIAFDYNSKWTTVTSDDPSRIALLMGTETTTTIQVIKYETGGLDLKTYQDELAKTLMTGNPISGNSLTVAGMSAYETVIKFMSNNVEFRMRIISLEKGGYFYSIVFSTDPKLYDTLNKDFNTIVNSFAID